MSISVVTGYGRVAYADVIDLHDGGGVFAVKLSTAVTMEDVLGERGG